MPAIHVINAGTKLACSFASGVIVVLLVEPESAKLCGCAHSDILRLAFEYEHEQARGVVMLLRSITRHVKDQNWFAVAIDFVIVVVGVFIGIQVANWNDERVREKDSKEFTARLAEDLNFEAWVYQATIEYYDDVLANAERVVAALEGRTEPDNEALMIAAFRATQFTFSPRARATFDELSSTGRLDLIKDDALLKTAILIFEFQGYDLFFGLGNDAGYREAFRKYIPVTVQYELADACGDRFVPLGDYQAIVDALDYPCDPEIDEQALAGAAAILRKNPAFLPDLRLRTVQLHTMLTTLVHQNADLRAMLQAVAEQPAGDGESGSP